MVSAPNSAQDEIRHGNTAPTASGAGRGVEKRTIDMVPDGERHGTPKSQFTLWFGVNMQITAVVNGALAIVFGADVVWAIIGLFIGQVIGGAVMALHSAQGPALGLPQMISSRAQFGVYGAALPLFLVLLLYFGFAATGTVLAGQAINNAFGVQSRWIGILVFAALTAIIAMFGYDLIHKLGKVSSTIGLLGLLYVAVRLFQVSSFGPQLTDVHFSVVPFLLSIALAAGWQLTYAPYASDYSRYLPRDTKFWECVVRSLRGISTWSYDFDDAGCVHCCCWWSSFHWRSGWVYGEPCPESCFGDLGFHLHCDWQADHQHLECVWRSHGVVDSSFGFHR